MWISAFLSSKFIIQRSLFHSSPFPHQQSGETLKWAETAFLFEVPALGCRTDQATGLTFSFPTLWKSRVAKVSFSKILESFPSKVWPWLEISHKTVARVNIIPAITFCTIPHESSQWFSTATGNNDSQLEKVALTLDIPAPSALWNELVLLLHTQEELTPSPLGQGFKPKANIPDQVVLESSLHQNLMESESNNKLNYQISQCVCKNRGADTLIGCLISGVFSGRCSPTVTLQNVWFSYKYKKLCRNKYWPFSSVGLSFF